ncbi:MFS transporter [Xylanimonas ulmi]|uniref:Transmembrane secretion effector n=1 Tax=Xylanimonas ulmi TaxID=228973 RepID=A0A4Q7M6S7_9MICO|nr:MFS transporter [Xylanibacterium ulmi]RZS62777.1 transmembrane secretion effector [Xylanibacterium ulmi]
MPRLLADLTPLRVSPDFRRLWWGLGVSNLGAQLTVVAVGLQVYSLTRSTLAVGTLGVFALVPLMVLGLYGGALVDRYDRRTVSLLASIALWLVTIAIALQAWFDVRSVHLLYGLVALQSAAFAINNPARSAIIPRLLPAHLMPAANALQTLALNVALTGGPVVGSALVLAGGYAWAYTIDAVAFTAALWATWRLPKLPPQAQPGAGDADDGAAPPQRAGGLRSVLDGLRYLATRPNLRTSFVVDLCAMVLAFPRVLWPAAGLVYLGGGAGTTGVLAAAFAAGGILATLFSGSLGHVRRQGRAIVWAISAWAVSIALFGVVLVLVGRGRPSGVLLGALVVACLALALAGGTDAVSAIFRQSILQTAAPDHMRGRLQGVFIVVVAGGPRLGELWLGAQASWFTEGWAAVAGGLLCLAALWLVVWRTPRFWRYDARTPEP